MSRVCITKVKNQDVYNAVKICFDEIVKDELLSGVRKVLIKPNLVNSSTAYSGVTTDLRIIASLIKILKSKEIEEIFVGESSLENTQHVFKSLDVYELEKLGASVVNFDEDKWVKVASPLQLALKRLCIPQAVQDCDLFISAAKMKTHDQTGVTVSVKNVLGIIPMNDRKVGHIMDIHKTIVDVFAYIIENKKFLAFVDGIYALEGKLGPTIGNPVKMDLIIAGDDAVAVDATCVEIMDYDINKVEHILLSNKLGLGEIKNREIFGENIENVKRKFDMPLFGPSPKSYLLSLITKKIFKRKPYLKFKEKCIFCNRCIKSCPIEAIEINNGTININYKECISCLVCCEACMQGALDYKISRYPIYKIAKSIIGVYHRFSSKA